MVPSDPADISRKAVRPIPFEVYTPKSFFPHAASLGQTFVHCPIFPPAASRRSLGRISVPVWPVTLSGRLPIEALVSRYLTNKLMGRGLIREREVLRSPPFVRVTCESLTICGINPSLEGLFPTLGQIAHVVLTSSPLTALRQSVRLAWLRHAASVRSEPGSNSP